MARQATANVEVRAQFQESDTAAGASSATSGLTHQFVQNIAMSTGTSDGQVDRVHSVSNSTDSTGVSLDLAGSLSSQIAGGATTTFADLQFLIVENTTAAGGATLRIGGVANSIPLLSATTEYIQLPPQGWIIFYFGTAGLTVTASTGDLLKLAASTGTVSFKVWLCGRSA